MGAGGGRMHALGLDKLPLSVWIGFDPREAACFAVARASVHKCSPQPIKVTGLVLDDLRRRGLYTRPTERRDGKLWDAISRSNMSTEFAISRFLTPHLAGRGLALFVDCDVLFRVNVLEIFALADPTKAVSVVKHTHVPTSDTKMDDQVQTAYRRKNWSSVMLFNCDHPANRRLTPDVVNSFPGLNLHELCWLKDDEVGELPQRFNYLVNYTRLPDGEEPAVVHWTDGAPCFPDHADDEYAGEFWDELARWAA